MSEVKTRPETLTAESTVTKPASGVKSISQDIIYLVFVGLAGILIIMGIIFSPSIGAFFNGYRIILTHPCLTDFDGLSYAGHYGTSYFNSGLLLLCVLLVYRLTKTEILGVHIAAAMMVVGFAFYGKNPINIWFPIIGVLGHTALLRKPLSSATAVAFFSTALSPVFSVLAYGTAGLPSATFEAYIVGALMGIIGGVLVSIFAAYLPNLHKGYVLFNVGFAAGFAGIFVNALLRAMSIGHDQFPYEPGNYVSGDNITLGITLAILFGYLIIMGIILGGGREFLKMPMYKSKGGNYVEKFGFAPSLINMGVIGLVATAYVFLTVKGQLNGCLFACIWTAVGFSANGLSVRMYLPTMAGVFIGAYITGGIGGLFGGNGFFEAALTKASSRSMLLAAIFSCGMAPIVGEHGVLAGIIVGMIHSVLVTSTGMFHGWMSLYNNGLSLSLIATFLYPVYSRLGIKKETAAPKPVAVT